MITKPIILVVDDDQTLLKTLVKLLQKANYSTLQANNGTDALKAVVEFKPDLVLLDVNLPDLNGMEVCRRIKSGDQKNTFVILISGLSTDSDSQAEGLEFGADGYLVRPISNRELLARVNAMLRIKAAEQALRISEEHLRSIYENLPLAYQSLDETGNFIDINKSWLETLGYPREEVIGKWFGDFLITEHANLFKERFSHFITRGEVKDIEFEMVRKDGEHIFVSFDGHIQYDSQKHFKQTHCILTDITDRKHADIALQQSEQKFRLLVEHAGLGVGYYDLEGRVLFFNNAALYLMGGKPEDYIGKNVIELYGKELGTQIFQRITQVARSKYPGEFEDLVALPTGTKWFMSNYARVYNASSDVIGVQIISQDVTERKQVEEALKESQRRLMTLMGNLPGMAYRCKNDDYWTMEFVSAGCYNLTGYQPNDLINNKKISYMQVIHPDDRQMVSMVSQAEITGKKGYKLTYRIVAANGVIKWVYEEGQGIFTKDGNLIVFEGFISDITERKIAEEALSESNELLSRFIQNSPIYAFVKEVTSTQSRVLRASENYQKMIGIPGSKMVGKTMEDLFSPEQAAKFTADDWDVVSENKVIKLNEDLDDRNYTTFKFPIFVGEKALLAGYTIDITDLKQTEAALRHITTRQEAILASIPDILMEVDANKVYTWANPAGLVFFGADVIGHKADDYFIGEQEINNAVQPLFDGDENTIYVESWQQRHDGEKRLLAWWCRVLKDENDNVIGALSTARDITETRLAEEEIHVLNAELEERVARRTRELSEAQEKIVRQEKLAVLGQMAGGVGHELRNPLGVISNAVYYLKMIQPEMDMKVKQYLEMIETETRIAEKIITDLLEFGRAKSGVKETVSISNLIELTLSRRPAPFNISVLKNLPADLPHVSVDPHQISQILENLMVNAFQAMPEGGVLNIHGKPEVKNDRKYVSVSVGDTGSGISKENMGKLFEPLFTTKPSGIGLGLAVCRKLIDANEGWIDVQSEEGKGSVFTVHLPVN